MYGLLFDGAWLWEEYVNSLIKDHFYHPQNKSNKGTQYLFTSKDNPHTEQIYPDFISTISQPRIIADAKYKPVPNIKHQDYLQVLAYMFRFDAKQGYYFYPKTSDDKDETFLLNEGTSYENNVKGRNDIRIIKQGLTIPEASSFDDFVIKIKASEQSFTKRLKEMMQMDFSNTSE